MGEVAKGVAEYFRKAVESKAAAEAAAPPLIRNVGAVV